MPLVGNMRGRSSQRDGILLAVLAVAAGAAPGTAQQAPAENVQPDLRISAEQVLLDAEVLRAKDGSPVAELKREDFRLAENGAAQEINYLSRDELPLSIVLMFDLTDTVRPVLKPLADGARRVLEHLRPGDELAVMVFSSHADLLQDFTTDREKVVAAIEQAAQMKSREATFLNEDMAEALEEAKHATLPRGRRVTLWLTDGTSNIPSEEMRKLYGKSAPPRLRTEREATEMLLHSDVTVAALIERSALSDVGLAAKYTTVLTPVLQHAWPPGDIKKYAELTGGPVMTSSGRETADRLAALLDEIRVRYTLGYRPSTPQPAGTYCKISLTVVPGADAPKEKLRVRTRKGYYR